MRRALLFAPLLIVLLVSPLYARGTKENAADPVDTSLDRYQDPQTLRATLAAPPADFFLVDVRTPQEYAEGHIPGAILREYTQIGDAPPTDDRNALIVLYCRSGHRAGIAYDTLKGLGYTRLVNFGGIGRWPYELASGDSPAN